MYNVESESGKENKKAIEKQKETQSVPILREDDKLAKKVMAGRKVRNVKRWT